MLQNTETKLLTRSGRYQVFRVFLHQGGKYRFVVVPSTKLNVWLYLTDKSGAVLETDEDDMQGWDIFTESSMGMDRIITLTPDFTDYYYLVVVDQSGQGKASITVTKWLEQI